MRKDVVPALSLYITPPQLLPLVPDVKRLAPAATAAEKTSFRFAGMKVEDAVRREAIGREKEERAAQRAATTAKLEATARAARERAAAAQTR